jgi:heptosyltransferase-3
MRCAFLGRPGRVSTKRPLAAAAFGSRFSVRISGEPIVPKSVLVFRIGSLGDTLVAVPALRAIRAHFPSARITLLCDRQVGRSYVLAPDLLRDTGLVDDFVDYPFDPSTSGRLLRPLRMGRLLLAIRRRRFDALAYLAPSNRPAGSVARDRRFFRATGIARMLGFGGFPVFPMIRPGGGFPEVPREADQLLARLASDGIAVPDPGGADPRLPVGERGRGELARWLASQPPDGGRRWISASPGCKQPVNRWPLDRYEDVLRALISRHDVWPVVFGGPEDAEDARRIVRACGRGYVAAGALTLGASILAMGRCALHVGNDTGTIHMAAAAGTRCVGIYSSRNLPGLWFPYGRDHRILRTPIECENCELFACVERRMACLLAIPAARVIEACDDVLAPRGGGHLTDPPPGH